MGVRKWVFLRGRSVIKGMLLAGFGVQTALGFLWMCCNLGGMQDFPESESALYRGFSGVFGENIFLLYLVQLAVAYGAGYRFLSRFPGAVGAAGGRDRRGVDRARRTALWGSLVLLAYPFALQCHLAVLPCSFQGSLFLLMLSFLMELLFPEWGDIPQGFSGDSSPSHLPFPGFRRRGWKRSLFCAGAALCCLAVTVLLYGREGLFGGMDPGHRLRGAYSSESPGPEGAESTAGSDGAERAEGSEGAESTAGSERMQSADGSEGAESTAGSEGMQSADGSEGAESTAGSDGAERAEGGTGAGRQDGGRRRSLESVLAGRVAWPTLWQDHERWTDSLPDVSEDVWWESAYCPGNLAILQAALERSLGEEGARELYGQMAEYAWQVHAPMVVRQIGWDVLGYAVTPLVFRLQLQGEAYDSFTGRNYEAMRGHTPRLTRYYVDYGCWWYGACLVLGLCLLAAEVLAEMGGGWKRAAAALAVCVLAAGVQTALFAMRGAGVMDYKCTIAVSQLWPGMVLLLMGREQIHGEGGIRP